MALPVNRIGDNPQQPSINSETYIPDQLIAGVFPLVTGGTALITGSAAYKRGTVMGRVSLGVVANVAGTAAKGTLTFAAQPTAADTLTFNGTVVTFVANGTAPVGNQVQIGLTLTETLENLLAFLSASTDTQLVKFLYTGAGSVITATAVTGGTGGNALTLATSSANVTLSGATLSGGAANTGNGTFGTISLVNGAQQGTYKLVATDATHFNMFAPNGTALQQVVVGTAYSDQLGFTITAGGNAFAANDQFLLTVGLGGGAYKPATAGATDGSQVPVAILVDDADATLGDVNGGVYHTGEFNSNRIIYDDSFTLSNLATLLRASSIFLKSCITANDPLS